MMRLKGVLVATAVLAVMFIGGCATIGKSISRQEQTSLVFNEAYLKYKEKRPSADPVKLAPDVWTLLPGIDQETFVDIEQKTEYLAMIYELSTIYADMFFSNAELENYAINKQQEWQALVDNDGLESASVTTISTEYEKFMQAATMDPEFIAIEDRMKKAKANYLERVKALGKDALIAALKQYLNTKGILKIKPPAGMNLLEKGKFVKALKTEAGKAATIFMQGVYTVKGTGLVGGTVITKVVIASIEVAGVVVTIAVDAAEEAGKIVVTAVNAAGEAVELAVVGGAYVIKATGEVVVTSAKIARVSASRTANSIVAACRYRSAREHYDT